MPAFFDEANGRRLERWSEHHKAFGIAWSADGLAFADREGRAARVAPLPATSIAKLPSLDTP